MEKVFDRDSVTVRFNGAPSINGHLRVPGAPRGISLYDRRDSPIFICHDREFHHGSSPGDGDLAGHRFSWAFRPLGGGKFADDVIEVIVHRNVTVLEDGTVKEI